MKEKMKGNNKNPRHVQQMARGYNLPDALVKPKNAILIPLYLRIEVLSLKKGFCFASDKTLSRNLNVNKSTIVRQRVRLEELGMVIREYDHEENRHLFPWWQWAAHHFQKGNVDAADKLLAVILERPMQQELFGAQETDHLRPAEPSDQMIQNHIEQVYSVGSFFQLSPSEKKNWASKWVLTSIADLCWLFHQDCTPAIYSYYQRLTLDQKSKIQKHAPFYALSNSDNSDYMMDLEKYLNPRIAGYKKKIRGINIQKKKARTGMTDDQAVFVADKMTTSQNSYFK